jgi:hypothetical protein
MMMKTECRLGETTILLHGVQVTLKGHLSVEKYWRSGLENIETV